MTIFELGENVLICCFEVLMLNSFSRIILNHQKHFKKRIYLFVTIVFTICILMVANFFDCFLLNLICVLIIYCAYTIVIYHETLIKYIISSFCFFLLVKTPEFFVLNLFRFGSFHDAESIWENELSRLCLSVITKVITFILIKCVEQIYRKSVYTKISNGLFFYLLILPVATIILLTGLFYADIHISEKNKLLLEVGTLMLLFANTLLFYLFDRLVETMEKAGKAEQLYRKSIVENIHYQQVECINERHRALLHDIKKYIRTAAGLLQAGEKDYVMQIFGKLDIKIENISQKTYCENKILNAILSEGQAKAVESGIEYNVEISNDLYVDYIEDIDMISITGNLIDNAMEAAGQAENGFVRIRMFMANEGCFMIWEVSNNFLIPPVLGKRGFITGKRNKEDHGIGIHTVEKIAKSYGGHLKIDMDNREFYASIIFPIEKREL